jgi:hypothetical protein
MNLATKCLVAMGQSAAILPDANKMVQGISYLCGHIQGW